MWLIALRRFATRVINDIFPLYFLLPCLLYVPRMKYDGIHTPSETRTSDRKDKLQLLWKANEKPNYNLISFLEIPILTNALDKYKATQASCQSFGIVLSTGVLFLEYDIRYQLCRSGNLHKLNFYVAYVLGII